ncbi:non-ribosomal peptide synthetase [Pseudomonas sp. RV120224-01b]|uniref:non-ribosomal peptide synthetase n=2 Tax=unclassified Pseudomonas TaxID=196821 RepID=UPI000D852092|nr:non-ribosomal peptide synthetase [Pseudomonas sp. RV120224-01b]PYG84437.1 non-ribosomal peptide synthase protein (TIGR01720 family)/amino acid adenylation domain-containing protein [Pseudomonas sp. RV120224-01b]
MQALLDSVKSLSTKERHALAMLLKRQGINLYGVAPIPARAPGEALALSYAQQRQWFLWQMDPQGSAYNIPVALRLKGDLDLQALQASFDALIARHETLRTTFHLDNDQPVQVIHPEVPVKLVIDTLKAADADASAALKAWVEQEVQQPFDLEQGPLLRVKLLRLAADDHVLVLTLHHIVSDGWSTPIMVDELVRFYEAGKSGQALQLPPLPVQYADYALWQRQFMEAGEREKQLGYWTAHLGDEQPVLELPLDRPRGAVQSHAGARLDIAIADALADSLKQLAKRQGVTLFTLLLASFQALLHRYSGQNDIRVGVPIANRTRSEVEGLIGFFVNTQVLKAEFDLSTTFDALVAQVHQAGLGAQAHQDLPFEQLVEALQPERSLSHSPLFQVMHNHGSEGRGQTRRLPGLTLEALDWEIHTTQFDLALNTVEHEHGIGAFLTYATALFDEATIAQLAGHWQGLLAAIVAQPQQRIAELPLLNAAQQQQVVYDWNRTHADYPLEQCLQQLIEAQVAATPDAPALVFAEQALSYRELNRRANQLAHKLREQGVGPDVLVGIAAERSVDMVIGLLGILKAGGAYVPLDPEYPAERLAYMMQDSGIGLLLTQAHLLAQLPVPEGVQPLLLEPLPGYSDADPVHQTRPGNLAYVIYTSGSTGRPKGAGNSHRALVNRLCWMQQAYGLDASDTVLQKTPFSFDVSVWEFFWPLLAGARLAVAQPGEHRDPERLVEVIRQHAVTTLHFVPSMLQAFMGSAEVERCSSLKRVVCSGEALPAELAQQTLARLPGAQLYNLYGPTEAAIDVTHWTCRPGGDSGVPIGRPIDNLKTHILGAGLQSVAPRAAGELYLGGIGLARGYHRRPALTAERFVPDPFDNTAQGGGRLYRTGDLARYRADGVIDYKGRLDHQVKIRGLRIELGEIETRLLEQPNVREAVVLDIDGPGGKQLAAYLVMAGDPPSDPQQQNALRGELREHLRLGLADYMVPTHLLFLERLPVTANGKLDRKALPKPDASVLQDSYVAPRNALEQQIAAIWAEVLKLDQVGVTDNFFELGGDSIISIQVVSRARQACIRFTPKALFQHQTVQDLASVATRMEGSGPQIDQAPVIGETRLLPIQQAFLEQSIAEPHHWNQAVLLTSTKVIDSTALEKALHTLLEHHDALRLRFTPPQDAGAWHAAHCAPGDVEAGLLWAETLTDPDALHALCERAQRSLNLQQGPLLRGVLATLPDGSQRLLLVIHHLAVDGVSWRILLEDLQSAYDRHVAGQPAVLPAKTTSTKAWAERLQAYAQSEALQAELGYWQSQLQGVDPQLPLDRADGSLHGRHGATVHARLDRQQTSRLLQQAPTAYRTQVNDLLLTALARVVARWTQREDVLVQLEGHGREDLFDAVDLTRTVGWLTSLFPVKLTAAADLGASIKQIKEQLRAIPDKGIGYGALRYLGDSHAHNVLAGLPVPPITFNYLGQLDSTFAEGAGPGTQRFLQPASESSGASQSAEALLENLLSINGQVYAGELSLAWTFSQAMFERATVQALADDYMTELQTLIDHCVSQGAVGLTPSDVPLAALDQAQLDALPIPAGAIDDIYPLSPMQQGMLFHTVFEQGQGEYVNQMRVNVSGLDIERFKRAWQAMLDRHDVLRAAFVAHLERPVQVIRKHVELPFDVLDWADQDDLVGRLDAWAEADRRRGFDLQAAPLLRLTAIRTGSGRHHLIFTSHHILMDGWSNAQLLGEVLQHYAGVALEHPAGRYRDYIEWLQRQDAGQSETFWRQQLLHLTEPTRLAQALRQDRSRADTGHGEHHQTLDPACFQALSAFARQRRVTVNTLLQAAWLLLLHRYTGQEGVAFGATVAGRPADLRGVEQQLGLFINTLPVAGRLQPDLRVGEWVERLQAQNLSMREHEHTPLYDIQRWAGSAGEQLFDTLLVFENYPVGEVLQQGSSAGLVFSGTQNRERTNYPLTLMIESGNALTIHYHYDRSHLGDTGVEQIARHFANLLHALVQHADTPVGELQMLDDQEQQRIVHDWNRTQMQYPQAHCLPELFEMQVARTPEAPALRFAEQTLSYRELNQRANRLASKLRTLGVGPDVLVAIAVERSVEMVVGLLAILKAGGAYVPLDPEYPRERLAYMMEQSGAHLLLTLSHLLPQLPTHGAQAWCLDSDWHQVEAFDGENLGIVQHPEHLAYCIYTSGSTGRPKGVEVRHQALVNFLASMAVEPGIDASDRVLALTSLSFDIAGLELYLPLLAGASVVLLGERQNKDPSALQAVIERHAITTIQATPSTWRMLLQALPAQTLRGCKVISGGEALPVDLAEQLLPLCGRIWNLYGPTETTIWSAAYCLDNEHPLPLLGKPIANTTLQVMAHDLSTAAAGMAGELMIGGDGLARGYQRRAALTAERFVPDPYDRSGQGGGRLYRTGDLASYRNDGLLEYVGRIDHQVKVRGYRIELGEIEARLIDDPAVREAVVIDIDGPGGKQLAGYLVSNGEAVATEEQRSALRRHLREQLRASLPDYMVPAYLTWLDALPLTPNGKLDRKALPQPDLGVSQQGHVAPQSEVEQQVAAVWAQLLNVEKVGLNDNFFDLGGHSLLALSVLSRLQLSLGLTVEPAVLFQHPVLGDFARYIESIGDVSAFDEKLQRLDMLFEEFEVNE